MVRIDLTNKQAKALVAVLSNFAEDPEVAALYETISIQAATKRRVVRLRALARKRRTENVSAV